MTAPACRIIDTRFGPAIEPQIGTAAFQPATGRRRSIPTGPEVSPGANAQASAGQGEGPGAAHKKRHEWSPPVRTQFTTHRLCPNCGLLCITRHEPRHWPWTEWQRNGARIQSDRTPACERVEVAA